MAKKQSFVMHDMWGDIIENLPDEQAGILIKAIYRFKRTGEASIEEPVLAAVFDMIRNKMVDDAEKYQKRVKANQENGKRGGRNKTQNNPLGFSETESNPVDPDTDTDTDTVTDTVNDSVTDTENKVTDISSSTDVTEDILSAKPTRSRVPYQDVVDKYNEICISMPRVTRLTDARRRAIKGRCSEYSFSEIVDMFQKAQHSDFLSGRNGKWNGCSFDWLMKPGNFLKVIEGNYPNEVKKSSIPGHDELQEFYEMAAEWCNEGVDHG